jgi:hypothetical protein
MPLIVDLLSRLHGKQCVLDVRLTDASLLGYLRYYVYRLRRVSCFLEKTQQYRPYPLVISSPLSAALPEDLCYRWARCCCLSSHHILRDRTVNLHIVAPRQC